MITRNSASLNFGLADCFMFYFNPGPGSNNTGYVPACFLHNFSIKFFFFIFTAKQASKKQLGWSELQTASVNKETNLNSPLMTCRTTGVYL